MASYTATFLSLRTEVVIAEIPVYGVYANMQMNVGGDLDITFQLDQTGKRNQDLLDASIPGRTYCVLERNGFPIWAGFIWSRTYSAQSKSCQLFGQSFEKYPQKQVVEADFVRTNVEQTTIFRDLWNQMQAVSGRNLNINIPGVSPTVISKTISVLQTDYQLYSEVMSSIADSVDGFDWYIALSKSGSTYQKDLRIGYPTLGSLPSASNLVLEYPSSIIQYYATETINEAGTNVFVLGAGEGSTMLQGIQSNPTMIAQGWPRWDTIVSRKDAGTQALVDAIALQQIQVLRPPMTVFKITLKGDRDPIFGSYSLGDSLQIVIKDPRYPTALQTSERLIKWELHPPTSEQVETVDLTFANDPDV